MVTKVGTSLSSSSNQHTTGMDSSSSTTAMQIKTMLAAIMVSTTTCNMVETKEAIITKISSSPFTTTPTRSRIHLTKVVTTIIHTRSKERILIQRIGRIMDR